MHENQRIEDDFVKGIQYPELESSSPTGDSITNSNLNLVRNVKVKLTVAIGTAEMTISELFNLKDNSIVKLNRELEEPVDLILDGKIIAKGEIVAVNDNFGIKIVEILQHT